MPHRRWSRMAARFTWSLRTATWEPSTSTVTCGWSKNIGVPDNHYGHSSSLLAWENLIFVQLDHSLEQKVMALDMMTGDEVWNAPRETISWSSPVIARTELGPQLLLNSESTVDAYNPKTGALLWSEEFLAGEVAPSPVYANGKVFAANEYALAAAVTLGGTAEAVESEIAWEYDYYLPEVASPISDGDYVYYGTAAGDFVCLNFETGEEVYAQELGVTFYSSPVLVGDRDLHRRRGRRHVRREGGRGIRTAFQD